MFVPVKFVSLAVNYQSDELYCAQVYGTNIQCSLSVLSLSLYLRVSRELPRVEHILDTPLWGLGLL